MIEVFEHIANTSADRSFMFWATFLAAATLLLAWLAVVAAFRKSTEPGSDFNQSDFILVIARLIATLLIVAWLVAA